MKLVFYLFIACIGLSMSAQSSLKGRVLDQDNMPIDFVSVFLFSSKDSSLVKAGYTEQNGNFQLDLMQSGTFYIKANFLGYNDYISKPFDILTNESKNLPDIKLFPVSTDLAEVVVKTTRPLVEIKADKTVFNVEGTINATGQNGLELLRKAPGVVLDNNNNISVKGRTGVQIFIDGKPAPFSGNDLENYLKNLQASQIQSIDIITNPSSKYEAAGTAGIIDIRLKKAQNIGGNLNINLGYNQGIYAKYNAGLSGNYRTQDFNAYGSLNYYNGLGQNYLNSERTQNDMFFNLKNVVNENYKNEDYKVGIDYFLTPNNTLGVQVIGSINDGYWRPEGKSLIGVNNGMVTQILKSNGYNPNGSHNNNYNLNYRFDDAKGQSLNIDADYGFYKSNGNNDLSNYYYKPDEITLLFVNQNQNRTNTSINIYSVKLDYERNLWGGKLSIGGKIANVNTANDFVFYDLKDGEAILNEDRTNNFNYKEKINALYVNYSKNLTKTISYQAGLRLENTRSTGELAGLKPIDEKDKRVDRTYTDLFPSAGISWQINKNNSVGISYSKRIDRPNYQSLNPFEYKLDELNYQKGNSFLNPQYSHSLELSHNYMGFLNSSINYTHTDDLFAEIIFQANDSAAILQTLNVAKQDNFGIHFSASIPIKSWWSVFVNIGGNYLYNKADLGEDKKLDLKILTGNIYMQQSFILPNSFSFELSGWFSTPGIWGGNFKNYEMWSVDAGIQKKILKERATIRLSVSDLFNTNHWKGSTSLGELKMTANGGWESRQLRLNFSYSIGNQKSKSKNRTTGMEDEAKRLQKSGSN